MSACRGHWDGIIRALRGEIGAGDAADGFVHAIEAVGGISRSTSRGRARCGRNAEPPHRAFGRGLGVGRVSFGEARADA